MSKGNGVFELTLKDSFSLIKYEGNGVFQCMNTHTLKGVSAF